MMKRVLFIAYNYPPKPGVNRVAKFCKYLPQNGWEPVVVRGPPGDSVRDNTLVEASRAREICVQKSPFEPPGFLKVPEEYQWWVLPAFLSCVDEIHSQRPDVIYSSGPPFSSHLVGALAKKRSGIPWVMELRDPWLDYWEETYPTFMHRWLDHKLFKFSVKNCSSIVVVGDTMKEMLVKRGIPESKIHIIYNGYDPGDFKGLQYKSGEKFRILHMGTLYGLRDPMPFLDAVSKVVESNSQLRKDLEIRFIGVVEDSIMVDIRGHELFGKNLWMDDYMPHHQAVEKMVNSEMLLLVPGMGRGTKAVLTGKLFEYMASGSKIISVGDVDGDAAKLIVRTGCGAAFHPDDNNGIGDFVQDAYNRWKSGDLVRNDTTKTRGFGRDMAAERVARLLEEVRRQG